MMNNKRFILMGLGIFILIFSSMYIISQNNYFSNRDLATVSSSNHLSINFLDEFGSFEVERTDGGFYSFIDINTKREIDRTARGVFEGDKLILSDNSLYEVEKIEGDKVYCRFKGKENISWIPDWDKAVSTFSTNLLAEKSPGSVALYSTHTGESYVPTSGKDSEPGRGDILQVTQTIANSLESQGTQANLSLNKHDPHDANAYQRSRRTAAQLLKYRPVTIIDVHRDGVPDPKFYARKIDGKNATQVRLVVGRQNQNMQSNLDFAKKIKAFYDKKKPGLIKGIFIAKGNYNQDLAPNSILIEVGTHTNSLQAANNGAIAFASLLPEFLGLEAGPARTWQRTGKTGSSIVWILIIFIVGAIGFLFLSSGSLKGSLDRVKGIGKEFTSFLGNFKRKKN
ncbi:MAG: stage sporulation protein [Clostridia bacterium]|jgi:stage II sporulation protein P|nr:stage sporulation protein [Clostridia bacterium]MDN5322884.1 stage sporulation protein [Clostridia bacterium]